jgi:hypothetical protein
VSTIVLTLSGVGFVLKNFIASGKS